MVLIILPRCDLCDSVDVWRCPYCQRFTCGDCVVFTGDNCVHTKYEPIESTTWDPEPTLSRSDIAKAVWERRKESATERRALATPEYLP